MLQIWLKRRNKFWPSLNGLLNNKFSTWAAASSTICSRGRPKFLRRCARTRQEERVRIAYKSPSLHDPFTVPSSQMPAAASASARIRLMVRRIGPMQPVWLEDYKLRMIAHGPENVFYRGRGNLHLGGAVSPGADLYRLAS